MMRKIYEFEEKAWNDFVYGHPNRQTAQACLENVSPHKFWFISEQHPDLVSRLHIRTRLMGNFGLNGGIPWPCKTDGAICFLCKVIKWILKQLVISCLMAPTFGSILTRCGLISPLKLRSSMILIEDKCQSLLPNWIGTGKSCYSWDVFPFLLTPPRLP